MSTSRLKTPAGQTDIEIPPPGDFPSFYLFAMHKSGSTLLNGMMGDALARASVPQLAIPEFAFRAGLHDNTILNPEDFTFARGYCYRGFRRFPDYLRGFDITALKKVLLVRDPRDMLVSLYFSLALSHSVPPAGTFQEAFLARRARIRGMDIARFCIEWSDFVAEEFRGFEPAMASEIRVFRYEDVIFDKARWLAEMFAYLGIELAAGEVAAIAAAHDIRPAHEDPAAHIRQVAPGNHRKHLDPATIATLDAAFAATLDRFGYR